MQTLDQLAKGATGRIEAIKGAPALVQRLMEFGMFEGETVTMIGHAPLGDPLEISVGATILSLRRSEAACVTVSPVR
jgi:ferrous iron transport protein A